MLDNFWVRTPLILLTAIAAIFLWEMLWSIGAGFADIILVFFLAWLLSFILAPTVRRLEAWHTPKLLAIAIVYVVVLLIVILAAIIVMPLLIEQLAALAGQIPAYVEPIPVWLNGLQVWLNRQGVAITLTDLYQVEDLVAQGQQVVTAVAQNAFALAGGIAGAGFNVVLILVLSFYMLLDGPRMIQVSVGRLVPLNHRNDASFVIENINRTFGGFIRGMFVQAVIYGIGTAILMLVIGLEFVVPTSLFAGGVMIIPFLGPFLGAIPPIVIALFTGDPITILVTIVTVIVLQQIVLNVIGPRVLGDAVGLHPVVVLGVLLIGIRVAGFWGALFAIPVAGVVWSIASSIIERRRESSPAARADTPATRGAAAGGLQ